MVYGVGGLQETEQVSHPSATFVLQAGVGEYRRLALRLSHQQRKKRRPNAEVHQYSPLWWEQRF